MKLPITIRLAAIAIALLAVTLFVREELAWRAERALLQGRIAAAEKDAREAETRQRLRDADLRQTLGEIQRRKSSIRTPQPIVRELPRDLPLPVPIALVPMTPATALGQEQDAKHPEPAPGGEYPASGAPAPESPAAASQQAVLPVEDLKPLFDFAQDCRACQVSLAATRADLADEQKKSVAFARERDAALQMARGGTFWRRTARAARWFALGALAGALAARAAH